ncbi:hypothetical protein DFH07DRAFT_777516 [Mycena maculata]|uniref:Uncharacterized protein n=1 Tax=Mycena maculata TaxID=230809 RepID=A0AAD7N3K9_9AGAR|nr:hypothetical protein DFH07DRAFT_777516 [Mycena maculata]
MMHMGVTRYRLLNMTHSQFRNDGHANYTTWIHSGDTPKLPTSNVLHQSIVLHRHLQSAAEPLEDGQDIAKYRNGQAYGVGLPAPSPTVVMSAEYEAGRLGSYICLLDTNYSTESEVPIRLSPSNIQRGFPSSRPDVEGTSPQKLLAESDDFGFRIGATAFATDIITKIDTPGITAGIPT